MDPIVLPGGLDPELFVVGVLIPFVTALLTKWQAPDWVKGLVTITLSAVAVVGRTVIDNHLPLTWDTFTVQFFQVWPVALITWLGATSDLTAKVNQRTATFGVGQPATAGAGGAPPVEPIKPTPPPAV